MSLIVSISGIRGVVGESLTPEVIVRYATAFAAWCRTRSGHAPTVIVGRDGRITGLPVADLVIGTLTLHGAHVRDIGICPTPTVQLAVEHEHAGGGISITASHNPMQWNGLKFLAPSGMFLDAAENAELWALADQSHSLASWDTIGRRRDDTAWIRRHIDLVLGLPLVNAAEIRRRSFRVVIDCVDAAGGAIVPDLLRELGCEVIEMACGVSGVFSHTPEPLPENLTGLAEMVRTEEADLGIAVDPDVDRLVLINEKGEPYGEEYTIATVVDFVLRRLKRPDATVVVNLSTTRAVDDIAARHKARVLRSPVGEINVARMMQDNDAVVGGEGSGGVILPDLHLGRDAIVGIGLILQALVESGGTISAVKESLPAYAIAKGKMDTRGMAPDGVLLAMQERHGAEGKLTTTDGVKIDFPDSWVHLRKSNTEPIVRIIAEAHTAEGARAIVERFQEEIRGLAKG